MKVIGYARTSTIEQKAGLESQVRDLEQAGCDRLFSEQASSVGERPELARALDYIREGDGDVFVVTKLDRFARSIEDAIHLERKIAAKGATLKVLSAGIDTSTPTGRLMFNVLGAIAEFERAIMLERQREGIAAAKARGAYKGRAPTVRRQAAEIRRLHAAGFSNAEIARRLGCHRSNIGRVLLANGVGQ